MICAECLEHIGELERLERIHHEKRRILQAHAGIPTNQHEYSALVIAESDAKLDKLICRLELKRHQRQHAQKMPVGGEFAYAAPARYFVAA